MTITSGSVTLEKDDSNLIGISIGGGAPYCPCLYIVQVRPRPPPPLTINFIYISFHHQQIFDNTAAAKDGTLQSGDELIGVDGVSVKGKSKSEVAKMIQAAQG